MLRVESILKAMPEFAYVFNKHNELVLWNKNLESLLGYSPDELYRKNVYDFMEKSVKDINTEVISKLFRDKEEQSLEQNILTKSGKKIPVIDTANYVLIDGEEYMVGMAIDISKLRETEEKLRLVITELQDLKDKLQSENIYLRKEIESRHGFEKIIGDSEPLMHSLFRVEQVAETDTTVLLEGETGTGKELFAHAIHKRSKRKDKPFVKVNCASLPASLIESELFGHEKGAFTGAIQKQIGRFELADQGTIFLDEIGELPFDLQAKLLHVLQSGEFERIGNPKTVKVDVRVIAATNCNLEDQIRKKRFRKDLYYRLNVYPITIAPLRDRISDIPLLAEHFVKQFNRQMDKNIKKIPVKTIKQLQKYSWPGNIRELENIIERTVIISHGSSLSVDPILEPRFEETDKLLPLAEYERRYIIKVLEKTYWRVEGPEGAARILDMHPETLRSRMRKLEIKRPVS
ncbi:MAG: sigma-54-dependent Fis family transcriptional regulator [Bacteroidetes bacterium]|nr:MAG: sigma-54-dependent Fis family transcriptional regulator [Bacteroidota bacterium]